MVALSLPCAPLVFVSAPEIEIGQNTEALLTREDVSTLPEMENDPELHEAEV